MSDINFDIGNHQIKGGRDYQDDSFGSIKIDENTEVFILADGMGGYAGGKEASETVIQNFRLSFDVNNPNIKEALYNALLKANEALKQAKEIKPEYSQMGTTFIAMYINQEYAQWISVGDSPLWLIRDGEGIKRVNQNHSIAGLLELQYQHGEITKEEMENSPNKHMLTSAITGEELKSIDRSNPLELKKGDTFILASDGVESLKPEEVEELVKKSKDNKEAVDMILSAVLQKGVPNQDNATITIVTPTDIEDKSINQKVPVTTPIKQEEKSYSHNNTSLNDILQTTPKKRNLIQMLIYTLSSIVVVLLALLVYMKLNPEVKNTIDANSTIHQKSEPTAQKVVGGIEAKKDSDKSKKSSSSTNNKKQVNAKKSSSSKSTKKDTNKNTQTSKEQSMPSKSVGSDKNDTTKPANTTSNNRDKSNATKQVATKPTKSTTVKSKDTKKDEKKSTTKPKVKVKNSADKAKKIEEELYKKKNSKQNRVDVKVKAEQKKAKEIEKKKLEDRDKPPLDTKTPVKDIQSDSTKINDTKKQNNTQPSNITPKSQNIKDKTKEDIKKDTSQNGLVFLKHKLESKFQKEARNNIRVLGVYVIVR